MLLFAPGACQYCLRARACTGLLEARAATGGCPLDLCSYDTPINSIYDLNIYISSSQGSESVGAQLDTGCPRSRAVQAGPSTENFELL